MLQRIGHDLAMNSNKPYSKYLGLGINQCDKFPFLLGNFYFYRTFCNKRTVCLLSTKSKEIWRTIKKLLY